MLKRPTPREAVQIIDDLLGLELSGYTVCFCRSNAFTQDEHGKPCSVQIVTLNDGVGNHLHQARDISLAVAIKDVLRFVERHKCEATCAADCCGGQECIDCEGER